MAENSAIEWTDTTWNPLAGCTEISPGCANCYAAIMARRLEAMGQKKYADTTKKLPNGKVVWTGKLNLDEDALTVPLKRKKPTMYFVNSMSDLFHEDVPCQFIVRVLDAMHQCPQHTFQVLTKRAERMRQVMHDYTTCAPDNLPTNLWLGVSAENQEQWDKRTWLLHQTPAAIRFVSAEPPLGPIDAHYMSHPGPSLTNLDWVIVGGESGPGARPMQIKWARSIIDQCKAAGVAVFMKQVGSFPIEKDEGRCASVLPTKDNKGGDMQEWPPDLRVRQFPEPRRAVPCP